MKLNLQIEERNLVGEQNAEGREENEGMASRRRRIGGGGRRRKRRGRTRERENINEV
jgi:hypothetical protein